MPVKRPAYVLTTTEAYARGGVQTYSRRVAEILSEYARQRGGEFHALSLLDSTWNPEQHPNPVQYTSFTAAAGNRKLFVTRSAFVGWTARPSITVVMHTNIAPVALSLRAAGFGGPYVLVLHGIEAWDRVPTLVRAAARGAASIVSTTQHTATVFAEANGIPAERFSVIPLAVGESSVAAEPSRGDAALHVLAAGRLSTMDSYKGFDYLVDAVSQARDRGADVRLCIVGSGDDLPRLQSRAASHGLNGAVRFPGSVCDRSFQQEISGCDVFAMPSLREGFGLVYIEAMRAGRPCIAGNHGGPPEVVTDGEDGFLVEHGNVDQLTERLLTLYERPELRVAMGRRAVAKVEDRYLFPRMRDSWFELLDKTVN
jgi:glycosyltransferase involved in cell wall biosynthesis